LHGIAGRKEATGRGVAIAVRECVDIAEDMNKLGLSTGLSGKRVIVQGLGNVGYHTIKFLIEFGATVVGICEYEGAVYNSNGLNLDEVINHRKTTGSILGFAGQNLGRRFKILPLGNKNVTTEDIKHYCTECGIKTKSK
jgi:glutamate dehydrogenase (NAD(P)+)